jgi:hypothetical protein
MGRDEWESALKLSTVWGMTEIRDLAIGKLADDLGFVDKILLGQEYGVAEWLLDGCKGIAEREKSLTGSEIRLLGPETAAKLWEARETGIEARFEQAPYSRFYSNLYRIATGRYNYEKCIRKLFTQELADAEEAGRNVGISQSHYADESSVPTLSSPPVQNERFYMNCIIFQVSGELFKEIKYLTDSA